jgi:hypothetical protein
MTTYSFKPKINKQTKTQTEKKILNILLSHLHTRKI